MSRQLANMVRMTLELAIPVAVVLLMTKPALRQSLKMQVFHLSKEFCQINADFWQQLATTSAQAYQNARL